MKPTISVCFIHEFFSIYDGMSKFLDESREEIDL